MNARELLALLTAKVQRYVVSDGGIPEVTQEDMSHAMGYIRDKRAALLIGVKYCGRSEDVWELDFALWQSAILRFPEWQRDKEYIKGREFIRHLCQMALNEHMEEHTCHTCKGTSAKLKEDLKHAFHKDFEFCSTCNDSGKVRPSEKDRARIVGVNFKLWERHWSEKYRQIQAILNDWEGTAAGDLQDALRP